MTANPTTNPSFRARFQQLWKSGVSRDEIRVALGAEFSWHVGENRIGRVAKMLGLPPRQVVYSPAEKSCITVMWDEGMTAADIARTCTEAFGREITTDAICVRARQWGLARRYKQGKETI